MSENGWRAECQDCPTTLNTDWGHQEKVHEEFPTEQHVEAELWGVLHQEAHPGHRVQVKAFCRWEVKADSVDPEIWRRLAGG